MTTERMVLAGSAIAAIGALATVAVVSSGDDPCQPSDGVDDRVCLQAAIDATCRAGGGVLHLGAGTWNLSRPAKVEGPSDNASLWIGCSNLTLEGDGPATVLMMTGDGYASDWSGVRVVSPLKVPTSRVTIADLTIASDESTNPNEQTHLLTLGPVVNQAATISDITIRGVRFRHPVVAAVSGDCLRMFGEPGAPVAGVDVGGVVFESCDRSGWAVQRGVESVDLHDARFLDIGKAAIDMEPSGLGAPIRRISMRGIETQRGAISISGSGGTTAEPPVWTEDVTLSDSHLGGRLGVIYARRVSISNVHVAEVAKGGEGVLHVRASENIAATNLTVRRLAGSVGGPAVKVSGANGVFPGELKLIACTLENQAEGHVLEAESVQDLTVAASSLLYSGPTGGAFTGLKVTATGRNVDRLQLSGVRVLGPLRYAVVLAGSPAMVGSVQLAGASSSGATLAGLRCENPLKFSKSVAHSGGTYDGAAVATSGCP